jgi:hypothetical protein
MAVTYEFECPRHGRSEEPRQMGDFRPVVCDTCGRYAHKAFSLPHVQEDRTRFWRGKDGTRYSAAFGCELPDSRSGIQALARERGVELDAHELPHIQRAMEVGRAKREGVKMDSREVMAHIAEPKEQADSMLDTLRRAPESTKRAIAERIAVGYENWRDRGAQSEAEMSRKGAEALGAGASVLNHGKPV